MSRPELRKAERIAFCRACDSPINKGTDMVSWYSPRNQGMHIHLCIPCAEKRGAMAKEHTNILAGAEVHSDKGYRESTPEEAEAFEENRNYIIP